MKEITMLFLVLLISEVSISQNKVPISDKIKVEKFRLLKMSKKDSTLLLFAWNKLYTAAKTNDKNLLDSICLKQIDCSICDSGQYLSAEHRIASVEEFLVSFQRKQREPYFSKMLTDSSIKEIRTTLYPESKPDNFKLGKNERLIEYDIIYHYIDRPAKRHDFYIFRFVKRNNQYKFSGLLTF
jgi:hypothetical protein